MKPSARVLVLVCSCVAFQTVFAAESSLRIWIDTDAACGAGPFKDVDDCLAIALLLDNPEWDVVGISTVFGNASLTTTDRTVRSLVDAWCGGCVPVYRGAERPGTEQTQGAQAISTALEAGPLTVFLFGPATNVSTALRASRTGVDDHRFFAVAGTRDRRSRFRVSRFSPVRLRDLNFISDPGAFEFLLSKEIHLSLVPFELARQVSFRARHINRLAARFPKLASQSRRWLWVWRLLFGSNQFYPFDAVALGLLFPNESGITCSPGEAAVVQQATVSKRMRPILHVLVPTAEPNVTYCHGIASGYTDTMLDKLAVPFRLANRFR